jgi:hypothetical protein
MVLKKQIVKKRPPVVEKELRQKVILYPENIQKQTKGNNVRYFAYFEQM